MTIAPMNLEKLSEYRSWAARQAALARWKGTYKADRVRYAKAIRAGKPGTRVRKYKRRKRMAKVKNRA